MKYRPWVDLQEALQRKIDANTIFTIDDAMRQFAREPGAPSGDYRITGKGASKEDRASRAYVVKRIQDVAGFKVGGTYASGRPRGPRQAQRIVAEGVKEPRSITAPRWKLIQAGAQKSHIFSVLQDLSDNGTLVDIHANIVIEDSMGFIDDRHRLIKGVFINSVHDNKTDLQRRVGRLWNQFIQEWRSGNLLDATTAWEAAYFEAMQIGSGVGSIYDVEMLIMYEIADAQERQEAA